MDTAKINTLKQVNDAIQIVDNAVQNAASAADQITLQQLSDLLEDIKNKIIMTAEQALINALSPSSADLNALADQLTKDAGQLDQVAATIKKVGDTVGTLVTITAAAVSAGLL